MPLRSFFVVCVQRSWIILAGENSVTVIARDVGSGRRGLKFSEHENIIAKAVVE